MSASKVEKTKQYFVALIPPSPIFEKSLELKQYFKENYNSKASLNSPPHITLHMPFRWKEQKESELIDSLKGFFARYEPLKVCLDNFGAFSPRVIFINVAKSPPLEFLQRNLHRFCKRELDIFNANYREQTFHPHITLAFRDLKKPAFKIAWEEFSEKEFKAEFVADKITLLKHSGKVWEIFKIFSLESSYTIENKEKLAATEG